jgi:hypothetical protein
VRATSSAAARKRRQISSPPARRSIVSPNVSADVAQMAEHRVASPKRPVQLGSSALVGPWCNWQHDELQPRWSGFESWWACFVAGRSGSVIWKRPVATRPLCGSSPRPTASHDRDDKTLLRAGTAPVLDSISTGRGFESRPGCCAPVAQRKSSPVRGHTTAAAHLDTTRGGRSDVPASACDAASPLVA